nr:SKP1-like protein 1A [Ipomoea batatas]
MSSSGINGCDEKMVRLRANDGEEFEVAESVAVLSQTVKFVVEDAGGLGEDFVIPLLKVDGKTLAKILEYCKVHAEDGKSNAEKKEFDKKFVEVGQAEVYDLLTAANYLEIRELLDIMIQRVADMIKEKSSDNMSSSGANNGEKMVTLRANDGEEFAVAESVVALSHTIKFVLEDSTMGETSVIPLFKVDGKTLAKILEYCKVHTAVGKTDAEKEEFDRKFVEVDQTELYALLIATNYLGISELQEKLVRRVADMITGKTPEEIRETFNIKNDLSPEEEEEIKHENPWAF